MKTGVLIVGETALDIAGDKPIQGGAGSIYRSYDMHAGGGAFGAAVACSALGMQSACIGKAGKDEIGTIIAHRAHAAGLHGELIYSRAVSSCVSMIYEDNTVKYGDANQMLSPKDIHDPLTAALSAYKYVYVGGACALTRLLPHLPALFRYAGTHGAITVLDPGECPAALTEDNRSTLLKALEYVELCICRKRTFLSLWHAQSIDEGFSRLRNVSPCTAIVYDDYEGARGLQVLNKVTVPALKQSSASSHTLFEVFAAGVMKAFDQGLPLRNVLKVGCATAGVYMSQRSLPTLDEVRHLYNTTYAPITL